MEIDSLQFAIWVQAHINAASRGESWAIETLQQWNDANKEEGLPSMEQQLEEWKAKYRESKK